ncbi:hypothetical protein [Candidatus Parabeggiatoa sp. HSG14]|uniref:hypothetical protein n=1 Tax=Candidatus Parabeggiatoa sp. HSG14 TaxID=3055593 RepID=UPI0025A71C0B|nr:hypothetical protein [Thiotrichales bacterium HSG14]
MAEKTETITNEKDRWLYLFKEGKNVDTDNPPNPLNTKEIEQAMKVLHRFSENETNYLLYQSQLDAVLKENTYATALEEAIKAKEQAIRAQEQAIKAQKQITKEKEQAQKKIQDLLLLLEKKGIDPDKELI